MTDDDHEQFLEAGRMTLWEHIAELRTRLVRCCIAIALGMVIGWIMYLPLLDFLKAPLKDLAIADKDGVLQNVGETFYAVDPLETFATRIKISAYCGIVLAMPVLLWQIWRFVTPGLYPKEKRYAIPFVVSALALFAFGAFIAYVTLTPALNFLINVGGGEVTPIYSVDNYVTLIAYMMLAFGAGFEFPVLLVALQMVGVLTPRKLLGWWRQAVVVIAIVAAVITPSADPISMAALAIPMFLFYLIAMVIGFVVTRRRRKKEARAAA